MLKFVSWPAAVGFLLGVAVIYVLKTNTPPGGESLTPVGVGLVLAVTSAIGAILGAFVGRLAKRGKPPESDE